MSIAKAPITQSRPFPSVRSCARTAAAPRLWGTRRRTRRATSSSGSRVAERFPIVRLGALGDIVHAIPVAAALRKAFPAARVDWLVSAKHRDVLDLVPVIDRRLVINDRGDASGGTSLVAAVRTLRRTPYDVAIDLQG